MITDDSKAYLNIIESIIVALDSKGNVNFINKKGCKVLGYAKKDILGKNWIDTFILEKDRKAVRPIFNKLMSGEIAPVEYYENSISTKHGERIIAWHNGFIKDDSGKIIGTIGSGEDITDKRAHDEMLKKSEKEYRGLFDKMINGFALHEIVVDKKGAPVDYVFLDVNKSFYRLTGLTGNIIGKKATEVICDIEKDPANWIKIYGEVALTGKEIKFESYSEGIGKWFSITAFSPEKNKFATIFEEVTERVELANKIKDNSERIKNSKDMLQKIVDLLPVRIFWKDKNLVYLGCNRAFAVDAGRESPKEMIGKSDYDMPWKEQVEAYRKDDFSVIKSGKPKLDFKEPQTTPEGKTIWLLTNKVPLGSGKDSGVLGTYSDITSTVESEKKIRESEEKYRAIYEFSPDAIVTISHPSGKLVAANPSAVKMFGVKSEEDLLKLTFPEISSDKQIVGASLEAASEVVIDNVMKNGSHSFKWNQKDTKGKIFPANVTLSKIKIAGKDLLQATVRDITREDAAMKESGKLNSFAINRELKMVELKNEINELLKKLGEKARYNIVKDEK